jgi:outer membrane lipoprotein SlyB
MSSTARQMHTLSEEVPDPMKTTKVLRVGVGLLVTLMSACATTDTSSTTWAAGAPPPGYESYPYPPGPYARTGQVQTVQEVVQRTRGNPAGGALAGALIGGLLFGGHGPSAFFGAASGAAVGAAASQGNSESRTYELVVRFDDGGYGKFVFAGYSPFGPGQRVVLTPQGLAPG